MSKKYKVIIVRGIELTISTDSEGYRSIETYGFSKDCKQFDEFIETLLSLRTEDDLEASSVMAF